MEELIKLDTKARNISLIIICIAIVILIIWMVFYLSSSKSEIQYLLYIGIALFLAGILVLTRIQFVLWAEKRVHKS
jgi:hypothetical protein